MDDGIKELFKGLADHSALGDARFHKVAASHGEHFEVPAITAVKDVLQKGGIPALPRSELKRARLTELMQELLPLHIGQRGRSGFVFDEFRYRLCGLIIQTQHGKDGLKVIGILKEVRKADGKLGGDFVKRRSV